MEIRKQWRGKRNSKCVKNMNQVPISYMMCLGRKHTEKCEEHIKGSFRHFNIINVKKEVLCSSIWNLDKVD